MGTLTVGDVNRVGSNSERVDSLGTLIRVSCSWEYC